MANPHLTYEGGSCRLEAGSWDNNKSESGRTLEHRRPVRIKDTVEGAAYSVQRWLYHDERSVSERLVDSRMSGPKPNQLRIAARVEQMLKPMNSSHRSDSAFSMESHETDESASDTSIDAASSNLQAMSLETPPKPIEGVVIEELMKWFKIWLRERLPPTGNSDGDTQTAPKQGESSSSGAKRKASSSSRARNNSNRDQSNKRTKKDNDQDRAGKATAGDPAKRLDARRFACPFYKHDPREYSRHQWKYCVHPGWETVHRIKSVSRPKDAASS
ncbi:Fc.00g059110.m01.CDS01 [Cosmosporella sp. VM-42]